jgi:serpin B
MLLVLVFIFTACEEENIISGQPEPTGSGQTSQAHDNSKQLEPTGSGQTPQARDISVHEIADTAEFSVELFKKAYEETQGENTLISPLSVLLALSMTANGADGVTLSEMESVLGGGADITKLNEFLFSYVQELYSGEGSKLGIANSIWMKDNNSFSVKEEFLQTNKAYYGADIFKSAFDDSTLTDINNWVNNNTDGLIEEIIDEISEDAVMFLINAIIFDAEWERVYYENNIHSRDFTAYNGEIQSVQMMYASEWQFISDKKATGFIKPYKGNHYSFAALLPNEGVSIDDYVGSLTGGELIKTLENVQQTEVRTVLPKFSFDYDLSMNGVLEAMGIEQAFMPDKADLSKLGLSEKGDLFISEVKHKTFIEVDELGTKAGAVTMVEIKANGVFSEPKAVILDRPFVFMLIDNNQNLPIFIGVVNSVG